MILTMILTMIYWIKFHPYLYFFHFRPKHKIFFPSWNRRILDVSYEAFLAFVPVGSGYAFISSLEALSEEATL